MLARAALRLTDSRDTHLLHMHLLGLALHRQTSNSVAQTHRMTVGPLRPENHGAIFIFCLHRACAQTLPASSVQAFHLALISTLWKHLEETGRPPIDLPSDAVDAYVISMS